VVKLLLRKAWRDVGRQRAQFAAIALTIGLGVALYGASFDAYQDLRASYAAMFDRLRFADLVSVGGDVRGVADDARALPEVDAVATRTVADVPVRVGADHQLLGRVVGLPAGAQPAVDAVDVLSGSYLDGSEPDGVLVEQHLARYFELTPGSRMAVHGPAGWQAVRVRGVAATAEYLWPARSRQELFVTPDDFGVLFVPEPLAERLAGTAGPNQALVFLRASDRRPATVYRLRQLAIAHSAADVVTRDVQPSNATLQEDIDGFGELSFLFPVLFLPAAGVATYLMMSRLVRAQRTQLGTLRRKWRARPVDRRPLPQLRPGPGRRWTRWTSGCAPSPDSRWPAPSPASTRRRSRCPSPSSSSTRGRRCSVWLSPCWPGRRLPWCRAWPRSGSRRPRPCGARSRSRRGGGAWSSGSFPRSARLPAGPKLVLRSLERNPRRSLTVFVGVALALVLILSSLGLLDTTRILLAHQFDDVQRQDAQVFAAGPVDQALLGRIGGTAGVVAAEPAAELAATLRLGSRSYGAASILTASWASREPGSRAVPRSAGRSGAFPGPGSRPRTTVGTRCSLPRTGCTTSASVNRSR
jgi:putative ABC transport system permease protein